MKKYKTVHENAVLINPPKEDETEFNKKTQQFVDKQSEQIKNWIERIDNNISKTEGKVLTVKEVMEGRSSKYEFIDFDKQEIVEEPLYDYGWCKGNIVLPEEEPKTNLERLQFPELIKEFSEYYKGVPIVEKEQRLYTEKDIINALHSVELKDNKDYSKIYEGMKGWFKHLKNK